MVAVALSMFVRSVMGLRLGQRIMHTCHYETLIKNLVLGILNVQRFGDWKMCRYNEVSSTMHSRLAKPTKTTFCPV
jgi:hypothetical protein